MWARVAQRVFDSVGDVYSYVFVLGFKSEVWKVVISGRTMILAALLVSFIMLVGQKWTCSSNVFLGGSSSHAPSLVNVPFHHLYFILFYSNSCLRHLGEHVGYMLDIYSLKLEEACSMD